MNENDFIISTMKWSFSRLESFYQCKYAWKKIYIDCEEKQQNAFAQYGSLVHKLLEEYEKGVIDIFSISDEYERRFPEEVTEDFPPNKYVDMRSSYFEKGRNYLENLDLDLDEYEVLGIEKQVDFEIAGKPFIGFIDLLLKDKEERIIILDHKSASMKWNKNNTISKTVAEKMKMYKRQLYLYAKAIIDNGGNVSFLEWNFFNDQKKYRIPFVQEEYEEALNWAEETIKLIEQETEWLPNSDYWMCNNLCDCRCGCEYRA